MGHAHQSPPGAAMRRRSNAVRLLERLLASGMDHGRACRALGLSATALHEVRAGARPLRLWQQIVVAALADAHSPALRGKAATLRAQLAAMLQYRAGTTITHGEAPVIPLPRFDRHRWNSG